MTEILGARLVLSNQLHILICSVSSSKSIREASLKLSNADSILFVGIKQYWLRILNLNGYRPI